MTALNVRLLWVLMLLLVVLPSYGAEDEYRQTCRLLYGIERTRGDFANPDQVGTGYNDSTLQVAGAEYQYYLTPLRRMADTPRGLYEFYQRPSWVGLSLGRAESDTAAGFSGEPVPTVTVDRHEQIDDRAMDLGVDTLYYVHKDIALGGGVAVTHSHGDMDQVQQVVIPGSGGMAPEVAAINSTSTLLTLNLKYRQYVTDACRFTLGYGHGFGVAESTVDRMGWGPSSLIDTDAVARNTYSIKAEYVCAKHVGVSVFAATQDESSHWHNHNPLIGDPTEFKVTNRAQRYGMAVPLYITQSLTLSPYYAFVNADLESLPDSRLEDPDGSRRSHELGLSTDYWITHQWRIMLGYARTLMTDGEWASDQIQAAVEYQF